MGKATIYRRWPSRNALIFDALTIMNRPKARPDTGSIREDLTVLLNELVQFLNRRNGGKLFMAFLNEAIRNPRMAEANRKITQEVRESYVLAIEKAVSRGELNSSVDPELMIDMLISPFLYRWLTGAEKPRPADVAPVLDHVLKGFAKG